MTTIYHLTTRKEWKHALATGSYSNTSLEDEGFIHCSTQTQLVPVAMQFFGYRRKISILVIESTLLTSHLKWEEPSGGTPPPGVPAGEQFPHLYGPLNLDAVQKVLDMERDADDMFVLPENLQPAEIN
jgi:uncharacterized protein (DUF952 family)